MLSATLTFAQTHDCDITEQYVDWGNNINIIFMRDQHSPPPMTNVEWGNNINFIFMRVQKLPPPQNNMLIREITSTLYLHEGSKFATPYDQYVEWGNNINFFFMRDQNQEGGTSTPGKRPGCSEDVPAQHFSDIGFVSHGGYHQIRST